MTNKTTILSAFGSLLLSTVTACGGNPQYTASGHVLEVKDQSYGQADYYCDKLANGQYMVVLTNFDLCGVDAGMRELFHGAADETNMRLVFPSMNLKKVPDPNNVFQVGKTDCANNTTPGTEAIAYFSHSTPGQADYDVNLQADSGTITIVYPTKTSEITGSFDLMFGSDHVKGTFDALFCHGITPGFGA